MYGRFTLSQLKQDFGLTLDESQNLFVQVSPRPVSELLTLTLQDSLTLATLVNTEKSDDLWSVVEHRLNNLRLPHLLLFSLKPKKKILWVALFNGLLK